MDERSATITLVQPSSGHQTFIRPQLARELLVIFRVYK